MTIQPLADVPISPEVAALPKADLHLHQEARPRFERMIARREGRAPYDWRVRARQVMAEVPPGEARLHALFKADADLQAEGDLDQPATLVARIAETLHEGAADGAVLVEIRCGASGLTQMGSSFMTCFRQAERQVQAVYPHLRAEALAALSPSLEAEQPDKVEQQLETCLRLAADGLAGIDFIVQPYAQAAPPALWETVYRWAARAADAGLGITVHAGEFSTVDVLPALRVPGLRRLGHAVYAAEPRLLDALARSGVTVECSLSCNVVLGAALSYETHPIRQFVDAGIPVTLNTDDPVRVATTIGREYAIAAAMGFSPDELLAFTRHAINASFTSDDRRRALLARMNKG